MPNKTNKQNDKMNQDQNRRQEMPRQPQRDNTAGGAQQGNKERANTGKQPNTR